MTAQRVAVTAAGGGIGLSIAKAFAVQGADVHICDIDASAIAAAGAQGLRASQVDVSDPDAVDCWIDEVLAIADEFSAGE